MKKKTAKKSAKKAASPAANADWSRLWRVPTPSAPPQPHGPDAGTNPAPQPKPSSEDTPLPTLPRLELPRATPVLPTPPQVQPSDITPPKPLAPIALPSPKESPTPEELVAIATGIICSNPFPSGNSKRSSALRDELLRDALRTWLDADKLLRDYAALKGKADVLNMDSRERSQAATQPQNERKIRGDELIRLIVNMARTERAYKWLRRWLDHFGRAPGVVEDLIEEMRKTGFTVSKTEECRKQFAHWHRRAVSEDARTKALKGVAVKKEKKARRMAGKVRTKVSKINNS